MLPRPRSPLRVAIVAASLRILGGQAVQAQRMLEGWQGSSDVEARLVPINPVPPRPFVRLLNIKYVRTLVTQACYWPLLVRELRHADVVHVFSASYSSFLLAPLPAIVIAKLLRKPVVLNYHSGEAPDHLAGSPFARHVLRHWVDANVVPSPFLRDVFVAHGLTADVVTNTIDPRHFAHRAREPLRPAVLSTRNFETLYNVACTLRAFAQVQARYPAASLVLVGAGSQDAALRALASGLGLRNVTFAGRVEPSEIARYYADADIYLQTPSIDNMPVSVLEAFSSGLPVVATRVGGVPGLITHGVQGLLAEDDDHAEVARQILRLLEEPGLGRRLADAAREVAVTYQWPLVRQRWIDVYRGAALPAAISGAPVRVANE